MKFIDKIVELPKISIKDLENRIRNPRQPSLPSQSKALKQQSQHVAKQIKITSPYYYKLPHSNKCQCQYHRLKRYMECIHRLKQKQLGRSYHICEESYDESKENDGNGYSCQQIKGLGSYKSTGHLLQPLERKSWDKFQNKQAIQQKNEEHQEDGTAGEKEVGVPSAITCRSKGKESGWKLGEVGSKINFTNTEYIAMISKRLSNNRYKEKYLKSLFGFIKMKSNEDRLYIYSSKAYIKNSINVLLNHFTMEQLIKKEELKKEHIQKIAYHMACKQDTVHPVLGDLKKAVDDMEEYLASLRRLQAEKELLKEFESSKLTSDNMLDCYINDREKEQKLNSDSFDQRKPYYLVNSLHASDKHNQIFRNSNFNGNGHENYLEGDPSFSASKFFQARRSFRPQFDENTIGNASTANIMQNTLRDGNENKLRKSQRGSKMLVNLIKRKSPRQTTLLTEQAENNAKTESKFCGKEKKYRHRKANLTKKFELLQFNQKYKHINYNEFCSKEQFIRLIDEIQRLDRNDDERAFSAYNILKIQKIIDHPERIHYLLETFSPLFKETIRQKLLKHTVHVRDKKYIDKLLKQLDQTIAQVKRTDPRHLNNEDLCPYKEDPTLHEPHQLRITNYKGHAVARGSVAGKIIYYEADEKVQRHITKQKNEKNELEQADLSEIKIQRIKEEVPQQKNGVFSQDGSSAEVSFIQKEKAKREGQKKVLQYMHSHHLNTFNYLNNQITQVCSSLAKGQALPRA